MNRKKPILLVEDNEEDIELTLEAFKEYDLDNRIDIVQNGEEALSYLLYQDQFSSRKKEKPCLILLDIKMPKMDGLEVLQNIRKNEELKYIPIVMLTSSALEKDILKCYDFGVNAYVVKPVDFHDFTKAVKNLGVVWAILNRTPY